jgi:hypothetical protein
MLGNLHNSGFYLSITLMLSILALTLIGGLALFCFTKAFGISFLGNKRTNYPDSAKDSGAMAFLPFTMIGLFIILIGFLPLLFANQLGNIIEQSFPAATNHLLLTTISDVLFSLLNISVGVGVFIFLVLSIWLLRFLILRNRTTVIGPTWACGYTAGNPGMQYTATSYADNVSALARKLVNVEAINSESIITEDIFPSEKKFETRSSELMETYLVEKPVKMLRNLLRKIAFLQTGKIQHYILYPFVFILIIFLLSVFNLI